MRDRCKLDFIGESAVQGHYETFPEPKLSGRGRKPGKPNSGSGRGFSSDRLVPLFDFGDTRKVRAVTPALAGVFFRASSSLIAYRPKPEDCQYPSINLPRLLKGADALHAIGSAFEGAWNARTWTEYGELIQVAERIAIMALNDPAHDSQAVSLLRWAVDRCNGILAKRGATTPRADGSKPKIPPDRSEDAYTEGLLELGKVLLRGVGR